MSAFDILADEPRWVAWRNEERGGKPTKVPYCPHTGRRAKANDPSTWGTRAEAENRVRTLVNGSDRGGIGIELGDLGADLFLAGVDLDSCIGEDRGLALWAEKILSALYTYAEISPSGTGVKAFFLCDAADVRPFLESIGGTNPQQWGIKRSVCSRAGDHGPAVEIYFSHRYFAVTCELWPGQREAISLLEPAELATLAALIPKATEPVAAGGHDTSRSAAALREGARLRREGKSFEEMCAALREHADPDISGWCRDKGDDRQLRRIWDKAEKNTGETGRSIVELAGGNLPWIVDAAESALLQRDRDLYQFGDTIVRPALAPVRIAGNKTTIGLRLVQVRLQHMRERFTRAADFQRYYKSEKRWLSVDCPEDVARPISNASARGGCRN